MRNKKVEQAEEKKKNDREKANVALLSIASNTLLTFSKVLVGLISGSVSILAEGIHSGLDLLAACIAFFAVKQSAKPADTEHTYGHGKIENISGTIEALLIFVAVVMIVSESVRKLGHIFRGQSAEVGSMALGLGLVVMGGAALINFFVSARLTKVARKTDSVALEADALHLRTDVYTSAGVFAGLLLIRLTGWHILDPIIALGVALIITKAAYDLIKEAFSPLVDVSLPAAETKIITEVISRYAGEYLEFHELRTRKAGAERHVDLHLVVAKSTTVEQVHKLCDKIENEINMQLKSTQVLIHAEPCNMESFKCPVENKAAAFCQRCRIT
jgi:cation diffusion facilitator family transporter